MVREFFENSGFAPQIQYLIGNALDIVPQLEESLDMVFIDADKINYINYYQMIVDKVRSGGIILADNVLWSGKVLVQDGEKISKDTQAILDFNQMVQQDQRVENVIFPIRDGMMMARKL
jgi:predicted O-methyltransferase YrrM